ncbi:tartrate-resistant acid phosphatase type 5 family protein [Chitinophagaceae bacterium LB-8]|uniref:acid phosphatase n=1 Tax=Paraflavisolibacter caeni TaxID=2982496 RepID=A0A9X2Y0Z5_9BACT|nr:tartrate-resistant acid phosphatase type 5 family protein [Paraflavisolibacter caeni]MCU7551163.1 tartrate-resistant acid phosphatase type 5 family protein [Paraflavisolibacter caeni]
MKIILFLLLFLMGFNPVQAQVLIREGVHYNRKDSMLTKKDSVLNFLVLGDWGRNGADHQKEVAVQMGKTAAALYASFIISTGDNFYPSGVISEQDPLFKYSFEDIYTAFSLQWDWYSILGNHDYKSNPDAQVAYSKISRRWKMPARYYAKTFAINFDTTRQVLIAFIDTNPLIPEFYKNPEYGPNVRTQDSTAQKKWLEEVLSNPSKNIKWKIVVGHHPIYTGGSRTEGYDTKAVYRSLKGILDRYQVDVYLSGHEHSLQHILPNGKTHHFISGSASEKTPVRLIPESLMVASEYGFLTFSVTDNEMLVQAIDYTGKVIYKTSIKK